MKKLPILSLLICLALTINGCAIATPTPPEVPSPSTPAPPKILSPEPIHEPSPSTEQIKRRYTWDYHGQEWTLELEIPESLYLFFKEIPRPPTTNYSIYVTHPKDDEYISSLAGEMKREARDSGFSELERIEFAAAFVQSLPYTADSITTAYDEYPRYPIETLIDNGGDCEDTSILLASLLDSRGYDVVLIAFPDRHCALGVSWVSGINGAYFEHEGNRYYYLETTDTGWAIGNIPEELRDVQAHIYDMTPTPILTHDWSGMVTGDIAELEITVENLGTKSAEDVYIVAGFDAGDGKLWNAEESESITLPVGQQVTIIISLQTPQGKHTRFLVQVIHDGFIVDESYSEWFDT